MTETRDRTSDAQGGTETRRRHRRRRRRRRRWLIALAVPLVLLALLYLFQGPLLRRFALPHAASATRDLLGLELSVDSLAVGLDGRARVRSLALSSDAPLTPITHLSFRSLEVAPRFLDGLLGDGGVVDEVILDGLDLRLDLDRPWPSAGESTGDEETSGRDWLEPLPRVSITNASVEITTGGETWRVADVGIELADRRVSIIVRELRAPLELPPAVATPIEVSGVLGSRERLLQQLDVALVELAGVAIVRGARWDGDGGLHRVKAELPAFSSTLELELAGDTLDADVSVDELRLDSLSRWIPGGLELGGRAHGRLGVRLPLDHLDELAVGGTISANDLSVPLAGIDIRELEARFDRRAGVVAARVDAGDASLPGDVDAVDLDALVAFNLAEKRLRLEHAVVTRFDSAVELSGELALSSGELEADARFLVPDLTAQLDIAPPLPEKFVAPLAPALVAGAAQIRGRVDALDALRVRVDVTLRGAELRDLLRDLLGESFEDLERLGLGERANLELRVSSDGLLETVCVDRLALRSGTGSVTSSARLEEPATRLAVRELLLNVRLAGKRLGLESPVDLELDGDVYDIGPARISGSFGSASVAAWRSGDAHVVQLSKAEVRLDELPVERLRIEALAGLAGRAFADAELRFAPDGVTGETDIRLRDLALGRGEARLERVEMDVGFSLSPGSITVRNAVARARGDEVRASGTIVLPEGEAGGAPWFEGFSASASVADAARWMPPNELLRGLSGALEAEATLDGPLDAPETRARIEIASAQLRFRNDIKPITELGGVIVLDGEVLHVVDVRGRYDGSPIDRIGGSVIFDGSPLSGKGLESIDVELEAGEFALVRLPDIRLRGTLDLRVHGPIDALVLGGTVQITRGRFTRYQRLFAGSNPLPFTLFSIKNEPFRSMRFNLDIRSDRNLTINNNVVRTDASLDIDLRGTGEQPFLVGTIWADSGRVQLPASALSIDGALVTFTERNPYDPLLQIELSNRLRGYDVLVSVSGSISAPDVALESSPPLEREKVLVLVTTGYTVEDIEDQGAERAAAIRLAGYLGSEIARYFSSPDDDSDSFFSRFKFETEASRQRDLDELMRLEYRITEHLFLQAERDYYGDYNLNAGVRLQLK